jgi:hypothetical protein
MDSHDGQSNKSSTTKVPTDEAVDGFPILESSQQGRKAVGLIIHRKHYLMNNNKSRMTRLSQRSGLGNSILEHS